MLAKRITILTLVGMIASSQVKANSTTLGVAIGSAAAVAMAASFVAWLKASKLPSVTDATGASITPQSTPFEISASAEAYASAEMNSLYPDGWSMNSNSGDYNYFYKSYFNELGGAVSRTSEVVFQKFISSSSSGTYAQQVNEVDSLFGRLALIPGVESSLILSNMINLGINSANSAYVEAYLTANGGAWPKSATAPEPGFVTGSGINYSSINAQAFQGLEGQTVDVKAALLQSQIKAGTLSLADLRAQATNLQAFIEKAVEGAEAQEAADSLEAANKVLEANGEEPVASVDPVA